MDNLCHTLAGAALGKAGLASPTRYGMATLMIAANLPDIDVAVFLTDTLPMSFRRGWTHGVLAQVTLPIALAAAMWAADAQMRRAERAADAQMRRAERAADAQMHRAERAADAHMHRAERAADAQVRRQGQAEQRPSFRVLLLLSYLGLGSHVFMDWLNSYGVRLLMPFSDRWFYGDALYIVDPWLYLLFAAGIALSHRARHRGIVAERRPARAALAIAAIYMVAMLGSNLWARAVVQDGLTRAGRAPDTRFMVTPVFVNPFQREVLVDTGERYEKGFLWFEPSPHFRPAGYGVATNLNAPDAAAALASPRARAYLAWSRFPFLVLDRTTNPPQLLLNDYRYSDASARLGWAGLGVRLDP